MREEGSSRGRETDRGWNGGRRQEWKGWKLEGKWCWNGVWMRYHLCVGLCDTANSLFLIRGKFWHVFGTWASSTTQSLKGREHHVTVCQRKHNAHVPVRFLSLRWRNWPSVIYVCPLFPGYCIYDLQFVPKCSDSAGFTSHWWPHPQKTSPFGLPEERYIVSKSTGSFLHLASPTKERREQMWQWEWEELERQTAQLLCVYDLDKAGWHSRDSARKHSNSYINAS